MKYPINYDFGLNWHSNVVPHLNNPTVKKSLQIGIDHYLSGFPGNAKYKLDTCPATYSSNDCHAMLMSRKCEIYMDTLEKQGKLPKEYMDLKAKLDKDEDDFMLLFEMEEEITKPLYEWKNIKYDLESYYLCGSCHSYAPTFELTLARIIEPDEKWMVRTSNKHSTVINHNQTKIFDLLYWAYFGDINNYMFGDKIKKIDNTLGGKGAYLDSSGKSSMALISFEEFESKIKTNQCCDVKIYNHHIACYPDNVIMLLKEKSHQYLVEVYYDRITNEISTPVY